MAQQEKEKKVAQRLSENPVEMVRARNEDGHFVKDDPSTPENEAWVEKPKAKKKPVAKKKAAAKKSKQVQQSGKTPEVPRNFLIFWYLYLCFPHISILYVVWTHLILQNIYTKAYASAMCVLKISSRMVRYRPLRSIGTSQVKYAAWPTLRMNLKPR